MNLRTLYYKTLNLKEDEGQIFGLLFLHSFFLGIFISFHFVPANAVFIEHFGGEQLPLAYIAAGATGYLITSLYSRFQKRVNSRTLFMGALLFFFTVPLLSRLGLIFISEKWLSFIVFIQAWPFISLVGVETGGIVLRFLDLRQVKRLFGLVNIGGIISAIISYLVIPLLTPVLGHIYDLLFISSLGVVGSVVVLVYIYKIFAGQKANKRGQKNPEEKPKENVQFGQLFKEKYFRLIFISATLSMLVLYFTDFGYLSSIKVQDKLLSTPEIVSGFISLVCAAFKIGELIVSYFSNRILSQYGVKLGLTILPTVTTGLIFFAAAFGFILGVESIIFFSFIVLNKSFERILRRGLDDPSFNILFQPLHDHQKLQVQTKVAVIMQASIGIAGALLWLVSAALSSPQGFQLKFYPLFFLPVLFIWTYIAFKLYNAYREKLRLILEEKNKESKREMHLDVYGSDLLNKQITQSKSYALEVTRMSVTILAETTPDSLEPFAQKLLKTHDPVIVRAVLHNIDPTWNQDLSDEVKAVSQTMPQNDIKALAQQAIENLDFTNISFLSPEEIEKLINSEKIKDKFTLIKYLSVIKIPNEETVIANLLEHSQRTIKKAAIRLAGKRNEIVLTKKLIGLLHEKEFIHLSANALIELGDPAVSELDLLFGTGAQVRVLVKATEILGRIGTPKAQSFLLKQINYPERDVQLAVINGLYFSRFQANDREKSIVRSKLEETIENILWIFASINDVESEKNTLKLIQTLDIERENNFEILFQLLSFLYQPATIDLIKVNIIGENTIFALEIIDNFISQDIKQLLIPLFDNLSIGQRLKKLHYIFPQKRLKFTDRLKDIIVRDYNKIDVWTAAKAAELLGKLHRKKKDIETQSQQTETHEIELWTEKRVQKVLAQIRKSEMPDEIFVCLYHKDELIYTTAAKIIYDENPLRCADYLKKLTPQKQKLMEVLADEKQSNRLLMDRVKMVRRLPLFFSSPENIVVRIAKHLEPKNLPKKTTLRLEQPDAKDRLYIILRGELVYETQQPESYKKNDLLLKGLNIENSAEQVLVKRPTLLLEGNRFDYFHILLTEIQLIQLIFEELDPENRI